MYLRPVLRASTSSRRLRLILPGERGGADEGDLPCSDSNKLVRSDVCWSAESRRSKRRVGAEEDRRRHPSLEMRMTTIERFDNRCEPVTESGCIIWIGTTAKGYGRFVNETGRVVPAHRWSYEKTFGPIPTGKVIDHLCRVPCCVNPHHLEVVTSRENVMRGLSPHIVLHKAGHCRLGHPFDYIDRKGRHRCEACRKLQQLARHPLTGSVDAQLRARRSVSLCRRAVEKTCPSCLRKSAVSKLGACRWCSFVRSIPPEDGEGKEKA